MLFVHVANALNTPLEPKTMFSLVLVGFYCKICNIQKIRNPQGGGGGG